jgi:hypothetical protein
MQHTHSCLDHLYTSKKAAAFYCHDCLTTKLVCKLSNQTNDYESGEGRPTNAIYLGLNCVVFIDETGLLHKPKI